MINYKYNITLTIMDIDGKVYNYSDRISFLTILETSLNFPILFNCSTVSTLYHFKIIPPKYYLLIIIYILLLQPQI